MNDKIMQADLPEPDGDDDTIKIRPLERIKLHPKVVPEPSPYTKGKGFSRQWILQDGRQNTENGSEMRTKYKIPKTSPSTEGIRKRMLKDFFWEQMLAEVMGELAAERGGGALCSEYADHFRRDGFSPRDLLRTTHTNNHLKYPVSGPGSSAITYYSESIRKRGPGDILEKFRRCQHFTKPMEERLDSEWPEC